jgi:glycosyltransferase involved in cell wall biosynthesis
LKHLVLLSDNYPNSNGEFFLDDEINIISSKFEKITVLCASEKNNSQRPIPKNVQVIEPHKISLLKHILLRFQGLFFLPLWNEILSLKKSYGLSTNFLFFKILLEDFVRSSILMQTLHQHQLTNPSKHILYSYWHDYKALAVARIRKKTGCPAIARCHRWDIYFYANNPPYLPYRKFILKELSVTCSISEDGISYLRQIHNFQIQDKIVLSRLGKINNKRPQLQNRNTDIITICSCSTIINVKRVRLIVDVIADLTKDNNVKWLHFGDGCLKEEVMNYASINLPTGTYEFKGICPNNDIMNFYASNYIDLFVNLSESEGIPVSIMEAQSAGIPVLATNVGGTSEIVNNENGFLVEKDFNLEDVVSIIQKYISSTDEEKQQKRNASYENWKQNYNAETNYNEFVKLLTTCTEPGRSTHH